jgi:heavy metal translocating P-type ATPase
MTVVQPSLAQSVRHPSRDASASPTRLPLGIASLALFGIGVHFLLGFFQNTRSAANIPLFFVLALGGVPLVIELLAKLARREFGSDMLAGISIITSVFLHEYLAGALVVLMLSGGEALEAYATRNASAVLQALARRMPTLAHRQRGAEELADVPVEEIAVGDTLVVFPHELCPVDGTVVSGQGSMDESYLTGEPYRVTKAPGTTVLSGAINGEAALTIRCDSPAVESRYARIMQVMRTAEQRRPHLRRLGDQLGAWYTPLAVTIALGAWIATGDPLRFLSVLVIATPCPLLIAIPITIIGAISLAARRGIIIKDPSVLENISSCRVAIFDKTGTLTYGKPSLTEVLTAQGFTEKEILTLVASLERYSKHPLSSAILAAAKKADVPLMDAVAVQEVPGEGLCATIGGHRVHITGRGKLAALTPDAVSALPPVVAGMECIVLVDGHYAAALRFRDEPRADGARFIRHLPLHHGIRRLLLISGDQQGEVAYLAERVGITEVFASQSPEQKLAHVREETQKAPTLFLGDGINDAPALTAATVGIAFGNNSEITGEAADAVVLDSSLEKVDILFHIGRHMRRIALQSAIGGMALSTGGMLLAASGHLPPVAGALAQEIIDVLAVLNALRVALPSRELTDY